MIRLTLEAIGGDVCDSVRLERGPDPTPGHGQVLVQTEAAPLNPGDFLIAAGFYAFRPRLPFALGSEGVGRVLEVGPGVEAGLIGRRVAILPTNEQGTWADRLVVAAGNAVAIGDGTDAFQAATLVNAATAHVLLTGYTDLKPGDWVGLTLANSSLGQDVITLAERSGLRVLAVVRRESAVRQLRDLGADLVLVNGDELASRAAAELAGERLRLLLDGLGGTRTGELAATVADGGTVVAFSAVTGQPPVVPPADLIFRGVSLHGLFIDGWIRQTPRPEVARVYKELAELLRQGIIVNSVEATYPLELYREAMAHAQRPERDGKVLFTPG